LAQYVLKVHSRCDLSCDHCYIYEHADQSWRGRPHTMSLETVRATAARIAEHAVRHRLRHVHVILHGGEPLLLGLARLRSTLKELRAALDPVTCLDLRIQSNGLLLSAAIGDLFAEHQVKVGISLDGDRSANDRHRRFANGASSHAQARRALALLRQPAYRKIYAGILCTIDVENDPIRVYEALVAEEPPRIDLLLPHATWDQPPRRPQDSSTPYAAWLLRIYDRWIEDGRPVPIRLFDSLLSLAAGGASGTEALGLEPTDLAVVETDGAWEQADSLKTAYEGAAATGFDVFSHTVDQAAAHPGIVARQGGLAALCGTCRACPVVHRCGGGLFAHRYRSGAGFDNPSVYCADLKELITSIDRKPPPVPKPRDGSGTLTADVLDEIGSGYGGASTIEYLAASQLSITRALLVAVSGIVGDTDGARVAAEGWELLQRLDDEAPEAVRRVLTHPYVRAWAVRCLNAPAGTDRDLDLSHLACLVAAVAVHAGVTAEITVPVRDGMVNVPTLGRLVLGPRAAGTEPLSTFPGGFAVGSGRGAVTVTVAEGSTHTDGWQPARRLTCEGLSVALEDIDPYRDCGEWPVAARLPPSAIHSWERLLAAAWRRIRTDAPRHAPGLRIAFRALVPLRPGSAGHRPSTTNRHAFGAVGAAPLPDDDALAALLVQEVQRAKLGAVLDLCDLVDPARRQLVTAAWRGEDRPIETVLREAYALLGTADIWRARDAVAGHRGSVVGRQFRHHQQEICAAVDSLILTRALTLDGERFVNRMRETAEAVA
jgi:uncharacterized protein